MEIFSHPALQALLAGLLSWTSISPGASAIFLHCEFSRRAMDCMLGVAFLGLLQPAADMAAPMPHLHVRQNQQEGLSTSWRRSILLW